MTDNEIYLMIRKTFAGAPRPEHFTNYLHCDECREHDDLLRSKDVESLGYADVGNPGWSPVPFMTAEAFRYYFPALVRVAFDPDRKGDAGNFVGSLLSNLNSDDFTRFALFDSQERKAILTLLNHLKGSLSERFGFEEDEAAKLEPITEKWTKFAAED